ncbi:unnamed protein product [marine sediment metagenome]|uniref:Uncharacterized protein n=1 Tax=marine sediment metagenome TaxID=412755 RepID=X1THE5_9ZZZZ
MASVLSQYEDYKDFKKKTGLHGKVAMEYLLDELSRAIKENIERNGR